MKVSVASHTLPFGRFDRYFQDAPRQFLTAISNQTLWTRGGVTVSGLQLLVSRQVLRNLEVLTTDPGPNNGT